jgi:ankyrin repeat protein
VNAQDNNGETALMWAAARNQNPGLIVILLKAGAEATAKDSSGKTAFDLAQANKSLKGTDAYRQLKEVSQ